MGKPVVHFEIIGKDPARLRSFYGELFGWEFDTSGPVPAEVSEAGNYGFITASSAGESINGGVGGGQDYEQRALFHIGVPDVALALETVERLGGKTRMGPAQSRGSDLTVAYFEDPEGHVLGLASTTGSTE